MGEGTTFRAVVNKLKVQPEYGYGFDIAWSRIKEAIKFTEDLQLDKKLFFVGDMFHIPMKDNSIDLVYTAHAVEPNGGKERDLLQELYRVASKYLILFEPSYELANAEQKKRMESQGYIKNLSITAKELGYCIKYYRLLKKPLNEKNPTAALILHKGHKTIKENALCDPVSRGELIKGKSSYFSKDSLLAYPIVEDIPCLNMDHAILATKYI